LVVELLVLLDRSLVVQHFDLRLLVPRVFPPLTRLTSTLSSSRILI
jgi:hypothetical protein